MLQFVGSLLKQVGILVYDHPILMHCKHDMRLLGIEGMYNM